MSNILVNIIILDFAMIPGSFFLFIKGGGRWLLDCVLSSSKK